MEFLKELFVESFSSLRFGDFLMIIKFIFIAISLFFGGFVIYAALRTTYLSRLFLWDASEFSNFRPHGVRKIVKSWQKITARLDSGAESEYKLSVIEADAMLNDVLKRMGFSGETLAERLKGLSKATIPNMDDLSEAHKVRNNVVHDPDYKLNLDEVKEVISVYEKTLNSLQAF